MTSLTGAIGDLAAADLKLEKLERQKTRAEAAERDVIAKVVAGRAAVEAAEGEVSAARAEQASGQKQLLLAQRSVESARRALDLGMGGESASIRQIEQNERLKDEAETRILEAMEREAAATAAVSAARAALGLLEAARGDAGVPAALLESLSAVRGERQRAEAQLTKDLRAQYQSLTARGAFSVVEGSSCGRCQTALGPQVLAELRRGELRACPRCHRWLVAQ